MKKLADIKKLVRIHYADDKEDFIECWARAGRWIITDSRDLFPIHPDESESDVIESGGKIIEDFEIYDLAPYHTTDYLRLYCEKFHPEVDFDFEFKTNKPGVFGRYQERFGYDYQEWASKYVYDELKNELDSRSYCLPWEEK